jgi:hypothetical protein
MQEKSMNKALLAYKQHQKQRSFNNLTLTLAVTVTYRFSDLTNTHPYHKNEQHIKDISKQLTIIIYLFTLTA